MRTDRTFVCTHCRVRCWPVRRCPACGETAFLGDLQQSSLADLEARTPAREPTRVLRPLLGLGGAVSGFAAFVLFDAGHVGAAEVAAIAALGGLVGAALRKRNDPVPATTPYQLLGSPVIRDAMPRVVRRGRVRASRTIVSPLTRTPCVAWRVVGTSAAMPLDDGQAIPFALLIGDDELEVDATIATLEIAPADGPPRTLEVEGLELERWLASRGVAASGAVTVREAIVVPGDELEVAGTARIQARADGYRGHSTREVVSDLPGSPLVLRAPSPAVGDDPVTIA